MSKLGRMLVVATLSAMCVPAVAASPPVHLADVLARADRTNPELAAMRSELAGNRSSEWGEGEEPREEGRAMKESRLDQRRVEVAAKVRTAFSRVLAAREWIREAQRTSAALEDVLASVTDRGASSSVERDIARIAVVRAAQWRGWAERQFAEASAEMLWLIGAQPNETMNLTGSIAELAPLADEGIDALAARALAVRSELKAARREYDVALQKPKDASEAVRQEARVQQAARAVAAVEAAIRIEVTTAVSRVHGARRALAAFALGEFVPGQEQRAAYVEAFRTGKLRLPDVVAALRELADAERQRTSDLAELAAANADVVRAIGSR